jgi:hypothetical protein
VRLLEEESRKLALSRLKYKLVPAPLYAGEGGPRTMHFQLDIAAACSRRQCWNHPETAL